MKKQLRNYRDGPGPERLFIPVSEYAFDAFLVPVRLKRVSHRRSKNRHQDERSRARYPSHQAPRGRAADLLELLMSMKGRQKKSKAKEKRVPETEFLKLDWNWKDAIKRSIQKEKPQEGAGQNHPGVA